MQLQTLLERSDKGISKLLWLSTESELKATSESPSETEKDFADNVRPIITFFAKHYGHLTGQKLGKTYGIDHHTVSPKRRITRGDSNNKSQENSSRY